MRLKVAAAAEKTTGADDQFIRRRKPAARPRRSTERHVRKLADLLPESNPAARAKEFFLSDRAAAASAGGPNPTASFIVKN